MTPLTDDSRRPAQFPIVTTLIIVLNVLGFMLELANGERLPMHGWRITTPCRSADGLFSRWRESALSDGWGEN
jgi:hypothetical protein